jgi:hypothetical protein
MSGVPLYVPGEGHPVQQVSATGQRGARQTARHRLGQTREVGRHTEILLGAAGGHAESGDDLVEDQHHAALPSQLAQRP